MSLLVSCCFLSCGGGGRGPEIGRVYGKVTLGGKPLPKASVQFVPEQARMSAAITDDDGNYELVYSRGTKGAVVGTHTVRVSTGVLNNETLGIEAAPELVPAKYNTKTTLKYEVKPGKNEINLDLDAQGEIIQPKAAVD
jgi:hypothetical protein